MSLIFFSPQVGTQKRRHSFHGLSQPLWDMSEENTPQNRETKSKAGTLVKLDLRSTRRGTQSPALRNSLGKISSRVLNENKRSYLRRKSCQCSECGGVAKLELATRNIIVEIPRIKLLNESKDQSPTASIANTQLSLSPGYRSNRRTLSMSKHIALRLPNLKGRKGTYILDSYSPSSPTKVTRKSSSKRGLSLPAIPKSRILDDNSTSVLPNELEASPKKGSFTDLATITPHHMDSEKSPPYESAEWRGKEALTPLDISKNLRLNHSSEKDSPVNLSKTPSVNKSLALQFVIEESFKENEQTPRADAVKHGLRDFSESSLSLQKDSSDREGQLSKVQLSNQMKKLSLFPKFSAITADKEARKLSKLASETQIKKKGNSNGGSTTHLRSLLLDNTKIDSDNMHIRSTLDLMTKRGASINCSHIQDLNRSVARVDQSTILVQSNSASRDSSLILPALNPTKIEQLYINEPRNEKRKLELEHRRRYQRSESSKNQFYIPTNFLKYQSQPGTPKKESFLNSNASIEPVKKGVTGQSSSLCATPRTNVTSHRSVSTMVKDLKKMLSTKENLEILQRRKSNTNRSLIIMEQ
mgnify:CR=1 FL=1